MIVAAFVAIGVFIKKRQSEPPPSRVTMRGTAASAPPVTPVTEVVVTTKPQATEEPRDDADNRLKLNDGASTTYIRDILSQQDQMLIRWPDRRLEAIRVWIEPSSTVKNWDPKYPLVASNAFD